MDMQKKVRDLFAKAESTHSEHEAQQAILKAQELIAKYNIVLEDDEESEEIVLKTCEHPGNSSFRKILGPAIAENFKARCFIMTNGKIAFLGHKTDVLVAKEVFEYAYRFANLKSRRIVNDLRSRHMNTDGVRQSYVLGFCQGIKEKLEAQSLALAVVVPQDVEEKCQEITAGLKPKKRRKQTLSIHVKRYSPSYHELGKKDGRNMLEKREQEKNTG